MSKLINTLYKHTSKTYDYVDVTFDIHYEIEIEDANSRNTRYKNEVLDVITRAMNLHISKHKFEELENISLDLLNLPEGEKGKEIVDLIKNTDGLGSIKFEKLQITRPISPILEKWKEREAKRKMEDPSREARDEAIKRYLEQTTQVALSQSSHALLAQQPAEVSEQLPQPLVLARSPSKSL